MSTRNTTTSRTTSASTSVTGSHLNQDDSEWTQTMSSDESEPGSSNNDSDSDVQWARYIVQGNTEAEADVLVYRDLASFGDPALDKVTDYSEAYQPLTHRGLLQGAVPADNSRETGIASPTEVTPPGQSSSPATSSVPVNEPTNRVQNLDNG
ncbi:uncharacterized protein UBRO2_00263 [Ustilago bromivora]|uniref:Uncharacterized protein n=1 Tax=Ustilago bromivora TaxID=307758 RepID=A0A8H8QGL8_9BASI|nr:uncharacterized protein UBRO2_00263 [Ustilago bromivora]